MIGKKFEDISRVESAKEDELSILTLELTVGISLTLVKSRKFGNIHKTGATACSNLRGGCALSYLSK